MTITDSELNEMPAECRACNAGDCDPSSCVKTGTIELAICLGNSSPNSNNNTCYILLISCF